MANEIALGTGLLQYGDLVFPNAIKARVQAQPEQDTTRRFTKFVRYRMEVEVILYPGVDENVADHGTGGIPRFLPAHTSADSGMTEVRRVLTTRGLPLVFRDKGIGGFEINTLQDEVMAGPTPELLAWEPVGDNFAVRVVWGVDVTIVDCTAATTDSSGLLTEFSYSMAWGIDRLGLTTRRITGHWEVVLNIQGGAVRNNADVPIRDRLSFAVPANFNRITQDYRLNARRDRVDFLIVDQEHAADDKNRYPRGVVDMNVSHNVTNPIVVGTRWTSTIRGTITVAKGQPRYLAWIAFLDVVNSRMNRARGQGNTAVQSKNEKPDSADLEKANTSKKHIIPGRLSITEDIYGRRMSFSWTYHHFSVLEDIFDNAGIWQPVGDSSSTLQAASLTAPGQAWTTRGFAGMRQVGAEPLVGLCIGQASPNISQRTRQRNTDEQYAMFKCEEPTPEESWIQFDVWIKEDEETRRYPLYSTRAATRPADADFDTSKVEANRTRTGDSAGSGFTQLPTIHQSGAQVHRIIFEGQAARLGHPIPTIYLKKYGGANCTPIGVQEQIDDPPIDIGGCLLYRSSWRKEYALSSQPSGRRYSTNPNPLQVNAHGQFNRFLQFLGP